MAQIRRRRRRTRIGVDIASAMVAGGIAVAAVWGDDLTCHYRISRENISVPDLTGRTVTEAGRSLPACVTVEPVSSALRDEPMARIVGQDPPSADLLDARRSVAVVLEGPEQLGR